MPAFTAEISETPAPGNPLGVRGGGEGGTTPSLAVVIIVLGSLIWDRFALVTRASVQQLRGAEFVTAARTVGLADRSIAVRHLLPNAVGPIIVAATIGVGSNMIAEAGLSFLGLGAQSPTISWGSMLAEGQTFLAAAP